MIDKQQKKIASEQQEFYQNSIRPVRLSHSGALDSRNEFHMYSIELYGHGHVAVLVLVVWSFEILKYPTSSSRHRRSNQSIVVCLVLCRVTCNSRHDCIFFPLL